MLIPLASCLMCSCFWCASCLTYSRSSRASCPVCSWVSRTSCFTCLCALRDLCPTCSCSHIYWVLRAFVPHLPCVLRRLGFPYLLVPYLLSGLACLEPTCSCTSRASHITFFRVSCALRSIVSHPPRILGALCPLCLSYFRCLMPSILSCLSCFVVLVSYTRLLCF